MKLIDVISEFGLKTLIGQHKEQVDFDIIYNDIIKRVIDDDSVYPTKELIGYAIFKFNLQDEIDGQIPTFELPSMKSDVEWLYNDTDDRATKKHKIMDFFDMTFGDATYLMGALKIDKCPNGGGIFKLPPIYQVKYRELTDKIHKLENQVREAKKTKRELEYFKKRNKILSGENKQLKKMLFLYTTEM